MEDTTAGAGRRVPAQTVRFIHTSDWQIGMKRHFLGPENSVLFEEARRKSIQVMGCLAKEHGAEFIVAAGDILDSPQLNLQTFARLEEALEQLPVPIYILPGNHDPLTPGNNIERLGKIPGVHIIANTEPIEVAHGVELRGAPLTTKHPGVDPTTELLRELEPTDDIRIVLGHGSVSSFGDQANRVIDVALAEKLVESGALDYLGLGDTHSAQQVDRLGRVWYSGAPEVTDYFEVATGGGENNSGHVLLVELSRGGAKTLCTVEELETGTWQFLALRAELNTEDDVARFIERLQEIPEKQQVCVKYRVEGALGARDYETFVKRVGELRPLFAALYERGSSPGVKLRPTQEELEDLQLGGYVGKVHAQLLDLISAEPDATRTFSGSSFSSSGSDALHDPLVATEALHFLYRALKETSAQ